MAKNFTNMKEVALPVDTVAQHLMGLQQRKPSFIYQGAWSMPDGSVPIQFKTNVSATSWGDLVDVNLYRDPTGQRCTARIKSECLMPTQIIDFGHSKRVVADVEKDIDALLGSYGLQ